MAATQTLSHPPAVSQIPKHGVLTLYGFGIHVTMQSGHLCIEDGIGPERRQFRLPRVGHGLRRLVVIGNDGLVSLAALRWLADQDAAFVMLGRDGRALATTGPVRPSDARLRRAQALAEHSGAALCIARELISRKLAGQERVVQEKLLDSRTAETIAQCQAEVEKAETMDAVCRVESQGASAYWSVWRDLPISFPKNDLRRVPDHWRAFDTRKSMLTGSQRLATNPVNAILNYLYAVLESEARLAASALGLDPGLGFMHMDAPARDSLACDLMEPIRPEVDAWVLDWVTREPLKREWFFEQRDGNCRLMAPFAVRLTETVPMWARAVAPFAEWIVRTLWSGRHSNRRDTPPPTRLTQRHKREVKGGTFVVAPLRMPQRENLCRVCGKTIESNSLNCSNCNREISSKRLTELARIGRVAAHTPEAEARRAETQRRNTTARHAWRASDQPNWVTEATYTKRIQPALENVTNSAIASALRVSLSYAANIRRGERRPHPRHWRATHSRWAVASGYHCGSELLSNEKRLALLSFAGYMEYTNGGRKYCSL